MKGKKFLSLGMAAVLACSAFPATSYAMETDAEVYEETDIIGDEEEGGGSSEGLREGDFSYYKLEEGGSGSHTLLWGWRKCPDSCNNCRGTGENAP